MTTEDLSEWEYLQRIYRKTFNMALIGAFAFMFLYAEDHYPTYSLTLFLLLTLAYRYAYRHRLRGFYWNYLDVVFLLNLLVAGVYLLVLMAFSHDVSGSCRVIETFVMGEIPTSCSMHYWLLLTLFVADVFIVFFWRTIRARLLLTRIKTELPYRVKVGCVAMPDKGWVRLSVILCPVLVLLGGYLFFGDQMIRRFPDPSVGVLVQDVLMLIVFVLPVAELNRSQVMRWIIVKV